MKKKIKYILLSTVLLSVLAGVIPMALAELPPPPPVTKYFGTRYSFDGWLIQGTISSTYSDDGNYLTAYMWGEPSYKLVIWKYWGYLRIYFDGASGSRLAAEYYYVPGGAVLKIVYTDTTSQSWGGLSGYNSFSINNKPVNYVQLTMPNVYAGPHGSYVQFDRVYLMA